MTPLTADIRITNEKRTQHDNILRFHAISFWNDIAILMYFRRLISNSRSTELFYQPQFSSQWFFLYFRCVTIDVSFFAGASTRVPDQENGMNIESHFSIISNNNDLYSYVQSVSQNSDHSIVSMLWRVARKWRHLCKFKRVLSSFWKLILAFCWLSHVMKLWTLLHSIVNIAWGNSSEVLKWLSLLRILFEILFEFALLFFMRFRHLPIFLPIDIRT